MSPTRESIIARLREIESAESVRILYACESGSRAWGFASTDSDYDVRFIYLRPVAWYLAVDLEHKRDVIEYPIQDLLDINGWDLRKALRLLRRGNPPLVEWLGSPIVYLSRYTLAERMRALATKYYHPVAALHHYLRMAQGNYRDYLKGETVWLKKYFYVLRPLLAIKWIERGLGVVPTEFQKLVEGVVDSPQLRAEIDQLVATKRAGVELGRAPRIHAISRYIEQELERLADQHFEQQYKRPVAPVTEYDTLFLTTLETVWGVQLRPS